jgi:threonine dehydrogenase-like Zn-dependent dehydrogenase
VATALGAGFVHLGRPGGGHLDELQATLDLVVHASATSSGLQTSLDLLAPEGTVLELSWYGDAETCVRLGGAFHSAALTVRASQVGTMAPSRRGRRTPAERLELALDLLRDPAFDVLLTGESPLEQLPDVMGRLLRGELPALCHVVTYPRGSSCSA